VTQESRGAIVVAPDDSLADAVEATLTASRALLGVVARSVGGAVEEVSLPQFRVLVLVASQGPMRVGTLAQRMGAVPSTFSRTLDRMVSGGWITRTENPHSRREVLVSLTDAGQRLVEEVTEGRRREIREILAGLSPQQRAAVTRGLAVFNDAAGEASVEDLLILGL
jgi:DNA-binding MarR family transcriptional regulator